MPLRTAWIDNLRGICLFDVLLLHTAGVGNHSFIASYFLSFVLAAFFFLSGVLLRISDNINGFSGYLAKRINSLVIPYFIFSGVSYLFWFFITRTIGGHAGLGIDPLQQFLGIFYGSGVEPFMRYNRALWFFPCLFTAQIIFFFITRLRSRGIILSLTVCIAVIGFFLPQIEPFPVPWAGEYALRYLPYLIAGYYSKTLLFNRRDEWTEWHYIVLSCVGALIHLGSFTLLPEIPVISYYLKGFSGILCWLFVVYNLPRIPFFSSIGKESVTVFALHDLTYSVITGIAVFVFGLPAAFKNNSLLLSVAYALLAGVILVVFAKVLHRYLPWVVGYRR